jgi:pimeloyl-ACP methyl ester carboxylesterase
LAVTVWEGPVAATPAVLVHGTCTWGTRSFEHQKPLSSERRIILPDRRGFGASPSLDGSSFTSDYSVDAVDVVDLLDPGAHLVGHSYGGTVAMLAAAARPDLVRSLTLIEPCAHSAAASHPTVAQSIEDGHRFMSQARTASVEAYADMVFGSSWPQPRDWALRAAATALHERPCWLADLAVEPLARADFPKLVMVGAWDVIPPGYRPGMADTMLAVSTTIAERIGATLVRVPGAAHELQRQAPAHTNALLAELWAAGDPAT